MQYFLTNFDRTGWTRSLPLPVVTRSLCNLCVLCASVVKKSSKKVTTETQRTQRLHREEPGDRLFVQGCSVLNILLLLAVLLLFPAPLSAQSKRKVRPPQRSPQTAAHAEAEFDRFVKQADEARLAERFDDAIALYGKELNIKPKWPGGWG